MPRADTKQAEKEYLARAGSNEWERVKPFSRPGADTLAESAALLHDFAVAMLILEPGPDDLILDIGAGGCWCSDLLGRLNRRSVAIDISLDMLRAGRSRPTEKPIRAVNGDVERLPFRSGTFDKAVCLSAIHHVPDIGAAVSEIARVLRADGVALFSEPGSGHTKKPATAAAVRDFGVLEQDIHIPAFVAMCREAGFRDVRLKPLVYPVPRFDLTLEQWQSWLRLAASKRPVRALGKMGLAAAELFGLFKRSHLFEEAFSIQLVRTLRPLIEQHPIIVASKSARAVVPATYHARIEIVAMPDRVARNSTMLVDLRVTNEGRAPWKSTNAGETGHVALGVQLLGPDGRLVVRDFHRVSLPRDVPSGDTIALRIHCPTPGTPESHQLKFDLVAEGVTWFEAAGSPIVARRIFVD
jgi:SAM-dependent methyltransferase